MISQLVIGSRNTKKIKEMKALIVPHWARPAYSR